MSIPEVKPSAVLFLLAVFFILWTYTEVSEMRERDAVYEEVMTFMHKGDRYTQPEGDALEKRVQKLEEAAE